MKLGQVNYLRKLLSEFKEIVSQNYRRKILCDIICHELKKLENFNKRKKIKILDYGAGYNPILIKKIIGNLSNKYKHTNFHAHCYDNYTDKQIKIINIYKNIKFKKLKNINENIKFDFCLIIDVLHHIDLENKNKIYKIIKKLKRKSKFLIIKDHFQYSLFSHMLLLFMDFFSNYGDGTRIPKLYFTIKSFEKLISINKLKEIKRINNKKYYKWYWPIINSKKIQFISILK